MSTDREDLEMIDKVAADWMTRREEGLSGAERAEFEAWSRHDPRHGAAIERLEATCALLRKLPLVRDELQPVIEFPTPRKLAPPPAKPGWPRTAAVIVACAAAVVLAGLGSWRGLRDASAGVRYSTSAGGYERVLLDDGSTVELNASSEARVRYSPRERHVTLLSGEAHFTVTADSARPFVVSAAGVAVRAVGTAFNVRLGAGGIEVLVTEGRVAVAGPELGDQSRQAPPDAPPGAPAATELGASERLIVGQRTRGTRTLPILREHVTAEQIRDRLAWQERKLVFAELALADVITEFNRRNRVQIVVEDPALAQRRVSGTFAADNVSGFVRLLESSGTVTVERRSEFELLLRPIR